ncbi:MAG: accessory gene regulator B family protein [Ignavibacteriales bacterium]
MMDALSNKLTMTIKMNVKDVDEEKAEIINYGLTVLFSQIIKTIVLLAIAYYLGILNLVLISMVTFGFYRCFAGGAHSNTHIGCFVFSSIIFLGAVYSSVFLSSYVNFTGILFFTIFIINCIIIYYFAPADVEQKPILSRMFRERQRLYSAFSMGLIFMIALTIIKSPVISTLLIMITLFESISMLPIIYKIVGCKYGWRSINNQEIEPLE